MISNIHKHVKGLINGNFTIEEFAEWIIDEFWSMHKCSIFTEDELVTLIVRQLNAYFAEKISFDQLVDKYERLLSKEYI